MSTFNAQREAISVIESSCVEMISACRRAGKTRDIVQQAISSGFLNSMISARLNDPELISAYLAMLRVVNDRTP